ncbi:MAG: LysE family translocator [Rhizobiaceae bacterium]|nr:LysE family translocator [Rhizobiaceae bacterium]
MEGLAGFLIAAFALTGSPGPNTLSLVAVGSAYGRKRGLRYMLGLNLGMVLVIAITGSGISGLLFAVPFVAPIVIGIAALYFIFLAFKIATAPPLKEAESNTKDPKWFEGVIISLLNPKAYAAMATLFSSAMLLSTNLWIEGLFKTGILVLVIVVVNVAWLLLGAALTPYFRNERSSRIINIGFAILLLVSVASTLIF